MSIHWPSFIPRPSKNAVYFGLVVVVTVAGLAYMIRRPTWLLEQAVNSPLKSQLVDQPDLTLSVKPAIGHQGHPAQTPEPAKSGQLTLNEYLSLQKDYQTAFLTIVGGLVGIITLLLSLDRFDHTRLEHANTRFKEAIELLGNDAMDVRLGAIYTLQQLMTERPETLGIPIVNILAAYVRNRGGQITRVFEVEEEKIEHIYKHSSGGLAELTKTLNLSQLMWNDLDFGKKKPPSIQPYTDIVAAMEVLAFRKLPKKIEQKVKFNFDGIHHGLFKSDKFNLYEVYSGALHVNFEHLKGKSYYRADLTKANLKKAVLTEANMYRSNLEEAHLEGSDLYKAHIIDANFKKAFLNDAHLEEAHF